MKYIFINSVYGVRSTGKIIASQCKTLMEQGNECLVAYARESIDDDVPKFRIGSPIDYKIHAIESRLLDNHGLASKKATIEFLKQVDQYQPDVIWMHNIHGYYLNYEILFDWLRQNPRIIKKWTLHDCWAFTGHCAYYTMANCDRWMTGCHHCSQLKTYPISIGFDNSANNYARKKKAFANVKNLTLITPSQWLADQTRKSFLSEYAVSVVNNSIDIDVFKPTTSDIRENYGLEGKFIVLGVAVGWEETKGYPDMMELRKLLDDKYVMVMVGLTQKQIHELPDGIIGIEKTKNQKQLAELYSAADVFVNPTHQDNYPTVNLEARACGTPVVTYNAGGSPESAGYEHVVPVGDVYALVEEIEKIRMEDIGKQTI